MRQLAVVVGIALAGCAYKPGSYEWRSDAFVGVRSAVGCLDIAIEQRGYLGSSVVLGYLFGNRCDRAAIVDLASVIVVGRTTAGAEIALTPFDPRDELEALHLDARTHGAESIAYPVTQRIDQVCVDLASLAHTTPAQWLCVGSPALAMVTP